MTVDTIITTAGALIVALASAAVTAVALVSRLQTEIRWIGRQVEDTARKIERLEELARDHDRAIARSSPSTR